MSKKTTRSSSLERQIIRVGLAVTKISESMATKDQIGYFEKEVKQRFARMEEILVGKAEQAALIKISDKLDHLDKAVTHVVIKEHEDRLQKLESPSA